MNNTILEVTGPQKMHCSGCERTVSFALSALPGVRVIKADHITQLIELMLSGETAEEEAQAELDQIGYEVTIL